MSTFTKDPDAVLDYTWDWSGWLGDTEVITTSEVLAPDGITVDSDSSDTATATMWLSGGEAGTDHEVTNRITTTLGRVDDRTILIRVRNR